MLEVEGSGFVMDMNLAMLTMLPRGAHIQSFVVNTMEICGFKKEHKVV